MRAFRALVLVAALASSATPALAAPDMGSWVEGVIGLLKERRYGELYKYLTTDTNALVGEDPALAQAICRAGARYMSGGVVPGKGLGPVYGEWFVKTAQKAMEKAPEDPASLRALAAGYAAKARVALVEGAGVMEADWAAISDNTLASYEKPKSGDSGRACADAAEWMQEGVGRPGLDADDLVKRIEAVAAKASTFAGGDSAAVATASLEFARARAALPKSPEIASAAMGRCLALLQPLVVPDNAAPTVGALHTEAVSFVRANRLTTKAEFRLVPRKTQPDLLHFGTPLSDGWRAESWASSDANRIASYLQFDPLGRRVRGVDVFRYDWKRVYLDPDGGRNSGDNLKAVVRSQMATQEQGFSKVTDRKDPSKGTAGKLLPPGETYELTGLGKDDGRFWRVRAWFWKGKESPSTFFVILSDQVDQEKPDPEVQAVLDSIVEAKKAK